MREPEDEDGECRASQHPGERVWTGLKPRVLRDGLLPPGNAEEIPTPQQPICFPRCPWAVCHDVAL